MPFDTMPRSDSYNESAEYVMRNSENAEMDSGKPANKMALNKSEFEGLQRCRIMSDAPNFGKKSKTVYQMVYENE